MGNKNRTKKKGSKGKFKELKCHPKVNRNGTIKKNSCLSRKSLKIIRNNWNKRHPDMPINKSMSNKESWNQLKGYMKNTCNNELCWIEESIVDNRDKTILKEQLFAPVAPNSWNKNKNEWLSSIDISMVMKQYEDTHDNFIFIGPSPIDFETKFITGQCVWNELCNINLNNLSQKGKTKIGIIFNTDPHYKPGSHWIAMFIDLNKRFIFYFDSNGDERPNEITAFIDKLCKQWKGDKLRIMDNVGFTHQKGDSECGMYCLYFIITLLEGKHKPRYFKTTKIDDAEVEKYREIYFNKIN